MKTLILSFAMFALTSTAQARVLAVELDKTETNAQRNVYVATVEACPGTFQSVIPKVTIIAADAATVDLKPILEVTKCPDKIQEVRFFILIDRDLTSVGLNPKTAKVYFQLQ